MRAVIQRVKESHVEVEGQIVGQIQQGLLILIGVEKNDTSAEVDYLVDKIVQLRIFADKDGKMNLSGLESGAEFLVVSQFTLLGDCRKGRRPSFDAAADPVLGEQLYNEFVEKLRGRKVKVEIGKFRAMMDVHLINDGPVTFILDSKCVIPE